MSRTTRSRCTPALLFLLWAGSYGLAPGCRNQESAPDAEGTEQADAARSTEQLADFVEYIEHIPGTEVRFAMVPIPGGSFTLGSPEGEPGRGEDEGPQRHVRLTPFWMGACEVTWDEYDQWSLSLEKARRPADATPGAAELAADGVTRPTPPYTEMTFGMGRGTRPAICMTQLAARTYCEWLSAKTGHTYRLPTEAEWEYACRAGTTTAYWFGDSPAQLGEHEWFEGNSDEQYHPVGQKSANPWGLFDMHGNVAEWTLDGYAPYAATEQVETDPLVEPESLYNRVVRGGSWQDAPELLRSAARTASHPDWKMQDPQIPQSVWYHTDAQFLGFRVVREYAPDGG